MEFSDRNPVVSRALAACARGALSCLALAAAAAPLSAAHAQGTPAPEATAPAPAAPDAAVPAAPAAEAPAPEAPAPARRVEAQASASGSGTELPEIVVTATRHSELLSKVPISISAFTQETLDIKGAKDIADVVRFTPGVTIDADGTNSISIRGISSSAGAGTTGIYIDDTPIQMRVLGFNSDDALPKAFDLDRIEVLRGPQGTLFGAGAEGGAVRYIMAQPNMNHEDVMARTEVSTTKGGAPSYEAGIAGGAPIIDNVLGFRASIWYRRDGGWIDRLDPYSYDVVAHDANYTNTVALRLAAKWAVSDELTITPSLLYQDRGVNDVTLYFPYLSSPGSSYRNAEPSARPDPDKYFLPSVKVESELWGASLISNTSYYTRREISGYSGTEYNLGYFQTFNNYQPIVPPATYPLIDGTGYHLPPSLQNYRALAPLTNQQQTFAEEVRLQSSDSNAALQWTTGLFFSKNNQMSTEEIIDPMLDTLLTGVFGPGFDSVYFFGEDILPNGDSYYNRNQSSDSQLALFGELTYSITEKWKVTAGARYSRTYLNFNHFADGPQNYGPSGGGGQQSEKPFTPKFSVSYQADSNDLFYATYAKGYRIGGANAAVPAACNQDLANLGLSVEPPSYKSDSVNSYELGAKNKLADNLRIATSIFWIKWNGIQQNIYMQDCGFQFTDNFGTAVAKGGDIQIEWAPTSLVDFDLAIGRTSARYTSDVGTATSLIAAAGDAVEGQSYGPAPPWTVALGTQFNFQVLDRKSFARIDYEYEGHSSVTTASEDPRTADFVQGVFTPKAYSFVSARAGTTVDKWMVSAFVDNLFNVHPQILDSSDAFSVLDSANPNPPSQLITSYTLRPRTIGITASYHM